MHAAMAIISGLIWPVMMVMNTLDALRIMSLKRIAIKQIKTLIITMADEKEIEVTERSIKLKVKMHRNGTYSVSGSNYFTRYILEYLKIVDITFNVYNA
jgi:hypothetical protein